jgi:hypothetical protein
MGLQLHKIKSIKLTDNSNIVEDFSSDVTVSNGDILSIMGVDYQIANIDGDDKLILVKPYVATGKLVSEQLKIKVLPGHIKSQVKKYGELVLITVEDMTLDYTKEIGIKTPGWWCINKYVTNSVTKYRNELLVAVTIHDEIIPIVKPIKPIEIVPEIEIVPIFEPIKPAKSDVKISTKK